MLVFGCRSAPNALGNDLMGLACWWLAWMNLGLISTTTVRVEITLSTRLLPLGPAHKLQRRTWSGGLRTSQIPLETIWSKMLLWL
ncbi:hypothetical protein Gotri_022457 [Gossypium trilobum]|uniref:Uncharacterized protein n=1 Tax=Gossypium trilobum TaxID=34281 RepID=A0A7J9DG22_9ROSI|nr:hypothetical protein [Gossypium trilobum]